MRFFRSLGWTQMAAESDSCVVLLFDIAGAIRAFSATGAAGHGDMIIRPAQIPRKNIQRKRQKEARAIPAIPIRLS